MKIKDYFFARFGIMGVSITSENLAMFLTANGTDGEMDFSEALKNDLDKVFLKVVFDLLVAPNVSEDDFSISYDKNSLKEWYKVECKRLGVEDLFSGLDSGVEDMSFLA